MLRRTFLRQSACVSAGVVAGVRRGLAADTEIRITPDAKGPEIRPHVYGQFIEHLGGVIYDGIWVGADSKIPNVQGIRRQFVDDMKRIGVPNFRWPGGCFADGYHWRDGIGDRKKRPRTYNYWQADLPPGLDHTENNAFGIHEFARLCRLTGAAPYLAANMASGSPREFHEWVQYANAPAGTISLAEERAANGDRDPFGVRFWGVGNESWGCGGNMSPQEYATLYRRFVTQLPAYPPKPFLVAVGPRGHSKGYDVDWTEGFCQGMQGHRVPVDGLSVHFYTDFRKSPEKITTFDAAGWFDVLREGARMEDVVEEHWKVLGKYDPERKTQLVVDEWGVWYAKGEEIDPRYILSQPMTLRDALHTAITFDIFNRHAEKVAMANVAQTINCIHSLFLAHGDRFARTPVYSVFEMYRGHMGGKRAALEMSRNVKNVPGRAGDATFPTLSGSASVKDKTVWLTVTNASLEETVTATLRLTAGQVSEARGQILTHTDKTAHNTLERPNAVAPAPLTIAVNGGGARVTIPAKAVAAIELRMS